MRKITKESVQSFIRLEPFKKWNTTVKVDWDISRLYLHWNLIATYNNITNWIWISSAGWETTTTKERLNWVLQRMTDFFIYQKDFKWYVWAVHSDVKIEFDIWNEFWQVTIF